MVVFLLERFPKRVTVARKTSFYPQYVSPAPHHPGVRKWILGRPPVVEGVSESAAVGSILGWGLAALYLGWGAGRVN